MKNNQSLGRPIHYFTKLEYGKYSDIPESEEYLGEENAEVYYEFMDIKTGSREKGIAFHNIPGTPANILAAKDSVNLLEYGDGDYSINPDVSYDDCVLALDAVISDGVPIKDITVSFIKDKLKACQKAI